jgi:PAS domain S-box-containing protein
MKTRPSPQKTERRTYQRHSEITERKHVDVDKIRSHLAAIVESSDDAIIGKTLDGVISSWNRGAEKLYGYSAEEVEGRPISILIPPDRPDELAQILERIKRGETVQRYETQRARKDGTLIEVSLTVSPIRDPVGRIIGASTIARDNTDRRRAEEALRQSEERYHSLFQSMMEGFAYCKMTFDEEGSPVDFVYVDVNSAFAPLTGLEDVVGKRVSEVIPGIKETNPELFEIYGRVASTGKPEKFEVDVKPLGISLNISVSSPAKGDFVAVFENITERRRAEEVLRQSEERYHSLFDRMLDGVYLSTHEGRFVDVNPALVSMFGYSSKQEMLDITDIRKELYFSPEERGSHILDTDQQEVKVYRMRRKDGSEIWVEDHGGYVHDEKGDIVYHEGILRDITERKRLEDKLKQYSLDLEELVEERTRKFRESEEKYRELFDASPVSLWEEDFSMVKQFLDGLRQNGVSNFDAYFANRPKDVDKCVGLVRILNVNKATLTLYGAKSVDEIIGGLSGVFTEESNRVFAGELVALAQGKKYYEAEFENRTLRGETKHCNVICAVVPGYEQSLAKVLVCIVDLTPQKQLESELVKSQRLAAIGETAAMVGHDLRNPLQGIAGAAYNIRRHFQNALDPSTKEMLAVIENGVEYANEIINDLLEFSREMQLQLLPTTPRVIVRRTLKDVQMPNNITVEDTTTDAPEILADEPKVKRVLTNIIQNAIDAMPEGGKLSIASMNTQEEVSISIRDTGFGIPQDILEKIWTPLHTTKAKGIGLGLPICKRIIESHGGSISIDSMVGKGTTITVKLPTQNAQTGGEPL